LRNQRRGCLLTQYQEGLPAMAGRRTDDPAKPIAIQARCMLPVRPTWACFTSKLCPAPACGQPGQPGQRNRLFPIAWTTKFEPASDRWMISVAITSFAAGPTRVIHPSELHSRCQAEIYSTPAALLKASIR
jgi:hypothetical protein